MKLGELFKYISESKWIRLYEDLIWDEPGKVRCVGIFTRDSIPEKYLDYKLTRLSPSLVDWNMPILEIYAMREAGDNES